MTDPAQTNWKLIAAIFLAGLFAAAQFGKLTLTMEAVQNLYPSARDWVPTLVSVVGIVGMVFGVVAGPFIARIGMSHTMLWALGVGAAMSFIQSTQPSIGIFALTRIVEGFSHLGMVIAGPTLIVSVARVADRPVAMGIWASFFGASLAVTAIMLPAILNAGGVSLLLLLHGGGMVATAGLLMMMLPPNLRQVGDQPNFVRSYKRLYTTPHLVLPGAGFVWYTAIYIALIAVLPIALNLPAHVIATIPLISIAGTLGAGWVARVVGPHSVMVYGFIASAVLMAIIWAGGQSTFVIYGLFLLMGAIPTGAFASIAQFNSSIEDRARATGGISHFGNVGTTLGTPLMVLTYQWTGLGGVAAMVLLCCACGVAAIVCLFRLIK